MGILFTDAIAAGRGAVTCRVGHGRDGHGRGGVVRADRHLEQHQRLAPEPERFEELNELLDALYQASPNYSETELGSIGVPVLVLDGEEEEFIKPEHARQLAALIPGSTLVMMPGAGHFAPFAKPATFNQIVLDYLAGKTVGAPATPVAGTPMP